MNSAPLVRPDGSGSDSGAVVTPVSVIVPAHNEAGVIGPTLAALEASTGVEADVVVVCNGCTDNTADLARAAGVRVIETPVGSKAGALELGRVDTAEGHRIYLDADIVVSPDALASVVDALDTPGIEGAAPQIRLELPVNASRPMAAYADVWRQAPYFSSGLIGSGFFGLTAEAQRRIGPWPSLIADDMVALCHLDPSERASVGGTFIHELPSTLRETVRAETRREAGRLEFALWAEKEGRSVADESVAASWLPQVARSPRAWPGLAAFLAVKTAAKVMARRQLADNSVKWSSPSRSGATT